MMVLNDFIDTFLRRTLWIWLPFYVCPILYRQVRDKYGLRDGK